MLVYKMLIFFNILLTSGVFPSVLISGKAVATLKNDFKLDFSSYLPISPLSNVDKILAKIMQTKILKSLSKATISILPNFVLEKKISTTHALSSLTENIRKCLDEVNFDFSIFVDLQKTIDTVEHRIPEQRFNNMVIKSL